MPLTGMNTALCCRPLIADERSCRMMAGVMAGVMADGGTSLLLTPVRRHGSGGRQFDAVVASRSRLRSPNRTGRSQSQHRDVLVSDVLPGRQCRTLLQNRRRNGAVLDAS